MTPSTTRWRYPVALIAFLVLLAAVAPGSSEQAEDRKRIRTQIGMEFVYIAPGTFLMGSPEDELNRSESEILHRAVIENCFYMQNTPVTVGQWQEVMGRPWFFARHKNPRLPVTRVSWHDTQKFITALAKRDNRKYRLPTEAEWEYAARAGTRTAYPWGDSIDCDKALYANSQVRVKDCVAHAKSIGLKPNKPAPVKTYAPNPWSLYDMHGNVWEWTADCFRSYLEPEQPPPSDCTRRVRRGGSWFGHGYQVRSANRAYAHPAAKMRTTGFRLVMDPP